MTASLPRVMDCAGGSHAVCLWVSGRHSLAVLLIVSPGSSLAEAPSQLICAPGRMGMELDSIPSPS